jgi:hypothetical protein
MNLSPTLHYLDEDQLAPLAFRRGYVSNRDQVGSLSHSLVGTP